MISYFLGHSLTDCHSSGANKLCQVWNRRIIVSAYHFIGVEQNFFGPVLGFRAERNLGFNTQQFAYNSLKLVCESLTSQKRINASSSMVEGWTGSLMRRPPAFAVIVM
jgi:hypothetical protein